MSGALKSLMYFIDMANRVNNVVCNSSANEEDIYNFVKKEYEDCSIITGISVDFKWFDYYGDSPYSRNALNLNSKIQEKAGSLQKIIDVIDAV